MSPKIAIFPASGALAESTIKHLLRLVPPDDVILISRDPSKNAHLGTVTRQADYNDVETLTHAFDGAEVLFLVSYPSIEHEARFKRHKTAIVAARASNVHQIFYTSLGFAGPDEPGDGSKAHVMQAHLDTEAYLDDLFNGDPDAFSYTCIRQGIYSESFPMYIGFPYLKDPPAEICLPHDGGGPGVVWTKRDELGEGNAKLILWYMKDPEDFPYANNTLLLCGPRSWSLKQTVGLLGEIRGKPISIRVGSKEEYVNQPQIQSALSSHGPSDVPRQWVTVYDAIPDGETDVVSPALERVIGRVPEGLEKTMREMLEA